MKNNKSRDEFESENSAVSIRDMAKALNLSPSTISRVLSRKQPFLISETTREKVLKAVQEMGYQPKRSAKSPAD
jgi:LacI family transcriptional regulator